MRTLSSIRCFVHCAPWRKAMCVSLLLMPNCKLEAQDVTLISLAQRQGKGMVIMVNKWDLIEKDTNTADTFKKEILEKIAPITYIPMIFASALKSSEFSR